MGCECGPASGLGASASISLILRGRRKRLRCATSTSKHELLAVWQRNQRSVIFIIHNIEEAIFLGDRVVVMTPRPGRIRTIVPIALPRPREVTSSEFNEYRREITSLLQH